MNTFRPPGGRFWLTCAALTTVIAGTIPAAQASPPPTGLPAKLNHTALSTALILRPDEPAAGDLARVTTPDDSWQGSYGDRQSGTPIPAQAHIRIGSISKTFEATVILQLAAEHKVDLDRTVQHYLPGLLPDRFQPITVRQLLNHTSGLPDIDEGAPPSSVDDLIDHRFGYNTLDQIISRTLRPAGRPWPAPRFAPGDRQEYNSLGYRIAGKLIENVTGHSLACEIRVRILERLKLRGTSLPQGRPQLPRPYLHGYLTRSNGTIVDVSEQGSDPSSMISTTADLERFIVALFTGRLLPPAQQKELFTLPRKPDGSLLPYPGSDNCRRGPAPGHACFSVGLMTVPLGGDTVAWGKTGRDLGYGSALFATRDLSIRLALSVGTTTLDDRTVPTVADRLTVAGRVR